MSYFEFLGALVTGAGTLASILGIILGIFFAIWMKQEKKAVHDLLIKRASERHVEVMAKLG
ncbi:TPA: hypothetical protein DCX16_04775 [bacterium]|nr:hypothetical protein [bacterium]